MDTEPNYTAVRKQMSVPIAGLVRCGTYSEDACHEALGGFAGKFLRRLDVASVAWWGRHGGEVDGYLLKLEAHLP